MLLLVNPLRAEAPASGARSHEEGAIISPWTGQSPDILEYRFGRLREGRRWQAVEGWKSYL
jgi:hypothetical protein